MSDQVFRTRVASNETQEAPLIPGPVQPEAKAIDGFQTSGEPETIELYEFERGHKLAESYFGLREVAAGDWSVKMNLSRIDKFIKSQMEKKQHDPTPINYRGMLQEIESKVGSNRMNGKARITRILNYITLMQKTEKINALKEKFFMET